MAPSKSPDDPRPGHSYPGPQKQPGPKKVQTSSNHHLVFSWVLVPVQKRTGPAHRRIPCAWLRHRRALCRGRMCHAQWQVPISSSTNSPKCNMQASLIVASMAGQLLHQAKSKSRENNVLECSWDENNF